jgi:hypothetical protein
LAYLGFQCLDQPPYSPDLAPSDYHLFPGLKKKIEREVGRAKELSAPRYRWDYLKVLIVGGITVKLLHSSLAVMQNNAPLEMLSVETAATDNISQSLRSNFRRIFD